MKTVLLGNVCDFQNGYAFESKYFSESDGMPLIRIRDIESGASTETRYTGSYNNVFIVKKGDYLIGMDGEFRCYQWKGEDALLNQRVCRLRASKAEINPRFLFYGINKYLEEIEADTAFTTVKHISVKQIRNIPFPLPPIEEQGRIVKKLDEIFAAIDKAKQNTEKNLQNSQELFESELEKTFTKPRNNWISDKVGNLFKIRPPKKEARKRLGLDDEVTFLPMDDLPSEEKETQPTQVRKLKDVVNSYIYFAEEDVLLAKITPCFENGKLAVARKLTNDVGFGSSEYIVLRSNGNVLPDILYYFLHRKSFRNNGKKIMTGASGHRRLPVGYVEESALNFPEDIGGQRQIIDELDRLLTNKKKLQELYRKKMAALEELRQSILAQAFNGEP